MIIIFMIISMIIFIIIIITYTIIIIIIIFIIVIIIFICVMTHASFTYARTQVHSFLNLKSDLLKTRKHNSFVLLLYYYRLMSFDCPYFRFFFNIFPFCLIHLNFFSTVIFITLF